MCVVVMQSEEESWRRDEDGDEGWSRMAWSSAEKNGGWSSFCLKRYEEILLVSEEKFEQNGESPSVMEWRGIYSQLCFC